ncbi:MAG: hypothetical protein LBP38_04490 [Desulfovibrio sp.]|jgi:hypothetical protein|nr:hypothetical protein [Desulfovibrio sp.]
MSLSRSFSIFLRNALVKQHPWFSCCASCGEITTPLAGRLCASLAPAFPVDAVLLDAAAETARQLRRRQPWLRRIFADGDAGLQAAPETTRFTAAELNSAAGDSTAKLPAVALLHLLPDIAEHYLVVREPDAMPAAARIADFFTPNGIPLLYCREDIPLRAWPDACTGHGCHAQTRQNSVDFLSSPTGRTGGALNARGYAAALFRWTYAEARAVPVPYRGDHARTGNARGRIRGDYAVT